jgi:RNA polymerase sigma factor (sigma-70 family)
MNPNLAVASVYDQHCDEAVWNFLMNNSKEAFAVIYYRFFKILLQKGLQVSNERELVKDCIHDLFVEIWENKANLATPVSVKAYLIVSLQRKILRQLRKSRSQKAEHNRLPVEIVASKEDQIILEQHIYDTECVVTRAVNSLTKRQREAIHLKFYTDLSYDEIADMMKISTDSIYNLVSKAISNLQREFSKEAEPSPV